MLKTLDSFAIFFILPLDLIVLSSYNGTKIGFFIKIRKN